MRQGPLPRVLVLARTFPNAALPGQGVWVERLVRAARAVADPVVVSQVPWVPPVFGPPAWRRFRSIPRRTFHAGSDIHYPRVPAGLVRFTHRFDVTLALPRIQRLIRRLHAEQPFDLIHAHFVYPDGVLAAKIGPELGIPVITTEHAHWKPWLDREPGVRRQVLGALSRIRIITAVSEATRRTVLEVAGGSARVVLLPNAVDEYAFPQLLDTPRIPGRILFVGNFRPVKGLDVLVRALALLGCEAPEAHLRVIGATLTRRSDESRVRELAVRIGLADRVVFLGHREPSDVGAEMRQAAVVAVPSRRESFSVVTIEALASGTPVVATRSGGPEELLDDETGLLVPVEDPAALAAGLREVLRFPKRFDPAVLRSRVLPRFGMAATADRLAGLYRNALQREEGA